MSQETGSPPADPGSRLLTAMGTDTAKNIQRWLSANQVLLALLSLAAAVYILWALAALPWRLPDEPAHFTYLQNLSREGSIPMVNKAYYYPDLYESKNRTNFLGVYGAQSTNIDPATFEINSATGHPPLYYLIMFPAYKISEGSAIESQLYFLRVMGLPIFLALVAVSYRFARLLFPDAIYLQAGIPMLIILHPQQAFISAGVMNDGLLTLLFTFFLYQLVLIARGDLSLWRVALMGLTMGLGMLTKASFMFAFPVAFAVLAVLFFIKKDRRLDIIRAGAIIFLVPVVISGWFYLRSYIELGNLQGPKTVERFGAKSWWQLWFATSFRAQLLASFLGFFSWQTVPLSEKVFFWFRRITELAAIGLTFSLTLGYLRRQRRLLEPWVVVLFGGVWVLFYLAATHFEYTISGAQGRYLFPALFPFWTLVVVGLTGWMPPSWRPRAMALIVSAAGFLSAWALVSEYLPRDL